MHPTVAAPTHPIVRPAFDGTSTLPRILDWPGIRARLRERPALVELGPDFFGLKLGKRYALQLDALGLRTRAGAARIEATIEGFSAVLTLRDGDRCVEDRWEVAVDGNGLVRECVSDHHMELWQYEPVSFSRFFEALLQGL